MIRYTSLEPARSDMALDAPAQNAAAIRANPDLALRSRIRKGNPSRSITFNTERVPFDDVRVRQAVAKAIDRDGLAWISGFGEFLAKGDFLAVNTRDYDPIARDALGFDPAAANRLLDEAGWTGRDAEGFRTRNGQRLAATLLIYDNPAFPANDSVAVQADLVPERRPARGRATVVGVPHVQPIRQPRRQRSHCRLRRYRPPPRHLASATGLGVRPTRWRAPLPRHAASAPARWWTRSPTSPTSACSLAIHSNTST